jgi:hypothetical protein
MSPLPMHTLTTIVPFCQKTALVSLLLYAMAGAMTPADKELYEKLGLSETEWAMVLDAKMPLSKVKELLRCGISIPEYFRHPWTELGLSESAWIAKRKSGLSDADMRAATSPKASAGEWTTVQAFFLPGYHQIKRGQKLKGWCMAAIAAGAVGLFAFQTARSKRIEPLGLVLLIPDMLWSGVDIGIQVNKEENPGASRFTQAAWNADVCLSMHFLLP